MRRKPQTSSLPDFVIHTAAESPARTIRESEFVEISRRDRLEFVQTLLNPPAPETRLCKAIRRHDQLVQF